MTNRVSLDPDEEYRVQQMQAAFEAGDLVVVAAMLHGEQVHVICRASAPGELPNEDPEYTGLMPLAILLRDEIFDELKPVVGIEVRPEADNNRKARMQAREMRPLTDEDLQPIEDLLDGA